MFTWVKVVTLDSYGREVAAFYKQESPDDAPVSLPEIVSALAARGEEIIEAKYVR